MPNARRCGRCRQTGHNVRTCPNNAHNGAVRHNGTPMGSVRASVPTPYVAEILRRPIQVRPDTGEDPVGPDTELDTNGMPFNYVNPNQLPLALPTLERYREDYADHIALFRTQRERIEHLTDLSIRYLHAFGPSVQPVKSPMPKHITDKVFEGQDCMICLSATTIDTFTLSKCGHTYCNTCYNDARISQCGECRSNAM